MIKSSKLEIYFSKHKGLTIVELMMVILILSIMATAAVPAMQSLFGTKSVHAVGKSFYQSIQLARSEAIQRSTTVSVSPLVAGNNWATGWALEYTDGDGNVQTIRTYPAIEAAPTFTSATFTSTNPIQIFPNGQASQTGSITLSSSGFTETPVTVTYDLQLSGLLKKTTSH